MKFINLKLKKEKGPKRNEFRKGPGCEVFLLRLVGLHDDDFLGPAHHLRRFRDRIFKLVRALRDRPHFEIFAILGDLLGEPLLVVLRVHAGSVHFRQLRELFQQMGFALIACPWKLVREQIVASYEVQDVVHAVHVARRNEPARRDAQHITKMKLFRLHVSTSFSMFRFPRFPRGRVCRIYTVFTMIPTPLRIAYYGPYVKPMYWTGT